MKICFISREIFPFFYGGIGTQVYAQMQFFLKKGHEIYFITEKSENFCELEFKLKYQNIKVTFIDRDESAYTLHPSLNYAFSLEQAFQKIKQECQIEIVFLFDYAAEGLFILLKKLEGKYKTTLFLLELQGATYECLKYNAAIPDDFFVKLSAWDKIQCYMENLCISWSDCLLSPSEVNRRETIQKLGLNREVIVIPNSINLDIFQLRVPSKKELTDVKTIVYVGRLEKRKGVDLLLESFISILSDNVEKETKLVLVGKDLFWEEYGESFQSHWQKIIPNSYKHRIKFLGHCSQETLKTYFSDAWMAVFPSRWEPFGNVCLEAIALGCPAIVTKNTGLMEVVGTDYDIFFDGTKGVKGLKSVLLRVLQDVDLRNDLAEKSYLRAKKMSLQDGQLTLEYIESIDREFRNSVKTPNRSDFTNLYLMFEEYTKLCQDNKNELQKHKAWIDELQTGKEWLEQQYYSWMEIAQQTQVELERSRSQLQQIQAKDVL